MDHLQGQLCLDHQCSTVLLLDPLDAAGEVPTEFMHATQTGVEEGVWCWKLNPPELNLFIGGEPVMALALAGLSVAII